MTLHEIEQNIEERYALVTDLPEFTVTDRETDRDMFPTLSGNRAYMCKACLSADAEHMAYALNFLKSAEELGERETGEGTLKNWRLITWTYCPRCDGQLEALTGAKDDEKIDDFDNVRCMDCPFIGLYGWLEPTEVQDANER